MKKIFIILIMVLSLISCTSRIEINDIIESDVLMKMTLVDSTPNMVYIDLYYIGIGDEFYKMVVTKRMWDTIFFIGMYNGSDPIDPKYYNEDFESSDLSRLYNYLEGVSKIRYKSSYYDSLERYY